VKPALAVNDAGLARWDVVRTGAHDSFPDAPPTVTEPIFIDFQCRLLYCFGVHLTVTIY
jgi:hypothetical protein